MVLKYVRARSELDLKGVCAVQEEFEWGSVVCKGILDPNKKPMDWQKIFEPHSFFHKFKNYLQVCPSCQH